MEINHISCHKLRRAAEYPPLEDQLDALWHAMDEGLLPKIQPLYDDIAAIKARYPKPKEIDA